VNLPQAMQDGVVHVAAAALVGYTVLLHTQLFNVLPVLAFLPLFCFCVVTHFAVRARFTSTEAFSPVIQPASDDGNIEVDKQRIAMPYVSRRASLVQGTQLVRILQSELVVGSSCIPNEELYSGSSCSISGLDDDFNIIDSNAEKSESSVSWCDDHVAFDYDSEESEEAVDDITSHRQSEMVLKRKS